MQIDLTPTEAARLGAAARRAGLTPAELVKRLAFEHLPDVPAPVDEALELLEEKHEILGELLFGCPWREALDSGSDRGSVSFSRWGGSSGARASTA